MQIRVMGMRSECEVAQGYYTKLEKDANVKLVQVSNLYPCRGSTTLFRVYITVEYYSDILETATAGVPLKGKKRTAPSGVLPGQMQLTEAGG